MKKLTLSPIEGTPLGYTELHAAVEREQLTAIKLLLTRFEVDSLDNSGSTALYLTATCDNSVKIAKLLHEHGANLNHKNDIDQTPLHFALACNAVSLYVYLMNHGANLLAKDHVGRSAFTFAKEGKYKEPFMRTLETHFISALQQHINTIEHREYRAQLTGYLALIAKDYRKEPEKLQTLLEQLSYIVQDVPQLIREQQHEAAAERINNFYQKSAEILNSKKALKMLGLLAATSLFIAVGASGGALLGATVLSCAAFDALVSFTAIAGFTASQAVLATAGASLLGAAAFSLSDHSLFGAQKQAKQIETQAQDFNIAPHR